MIMSRVSAVLGSIVADAASLPLEWIYKDSTMKVTALKGMFAKNERGTGLRRIVLKSNHALF